MLPEAVIYVTAAGTRQVNQTGACTLCMTAQGDGKCHGLKWAVFSICIFQESLFVILRSDFTFSKKAIFLILFAIISFSSYELVRGSSLICEVVMYREHAAGY